MLIQIEPYEMNGQFPYTKIMYSIEHIDPQKVLCQIPLTMHTIPAARVDHFSIVDSHGTINYHLEKSNTYPYDYYNVIPERKISGKVRITYYVYPRVISDEDRCGPYLDFREEKGGCNTSGEAILLHFDHLEGNTYFSYNLAHTNEGKGVCGYGTGTIEYRGDINYFRSTYYAFGHIQEYSYDQFHFYYFEEPTFNCKEIAEYTYQLFKLMKEFFLDTDPNYSIYLRHDPFSHSGGSALKRSYMFGWNDTEEVSLENLQNILAHELVHNYPHLLDEPYGIGTWYEEGIAEYYSVVLPLRANLITLEQMQKEIQKRADSYYSNPYNTYDNETIGKICWEERKSQTVPYGRGFFYLANVDVKIRQATSEQHGINSVVLKLIERERNNLSITNQDFLDAVKEVSGLDLSEEFTSMQQGKLFAPMAGSFEDLFDIEEKELIQEDSQKSVIGYNFNIKRQFR